MGGRPEERVEARHDGDVDFFAAIPDDLDRVVSVPQAFDNQWVPDALLEQAMDPRRRQNDDSLEAKRMPYVRREYLRALVNTGQVVINRAFLYNNPAIYRDYARPGQDRDDFKKLLNGKVVIPYLYAEPSPATQPGGFTRRDVGWEGWRQVISESAPTCLRLSWDSDEENATQASRQLATPSYRFIETVNYLEPAVLAADFRLSAEESAALASRLREVAAWAHRRSEAGERLNREDVYQAFVVADGTDPSNRRYDPAKPFSAAIKQLVDLRYNANLADALGSYLLSPEDSLRRRALQEWRDDARSGGIADAQRLVQVVSNLRFDQVTEVLGALAAFEQLTLGGIFELRSTPAWEHYHTVLRAFLAQQSLEAFGDVEHGAEAVALAYRQVIKQAGDIAAQHSEIKIRRRWDPVVEITVEYAGALVSILYNPAGTGGNVFRVIRPLAAGVAARSAKAVFHLVIGRVTRSRGRSRVDNNLRVLDTRLDHGRRDWEEFIRALDRNKPQPVSSARPVRPLRSLLLAATPPPTTSECPFGYLRRNHATAFAVRSVSASQIASSTEAARSVWSRRSRLPLAAVIWRTAVFSPENEKSQPGLPFIGRGRAKRDGSPRARGRFDGRPAGIAEPDQLCRLVECLAGGVVERCPETGIAADSGADEELTMPTRNEQQADRGSRPHRSGGPSARGPSRWLTARNGLSAAQASPLAIVVPTIRPPIKPGPGRSSYPVDLGERNAGLGECAR